MKRVLSLQKECIKILEQHGTDGNTAIKNMDDRLNTVEIEIKVLREGIGKQSPPKFTTGNNLKTIGKIAPGKIIPRLKAGALNW